MAASIVRAASGRPSHIAPPLFLGAQSVVGCMIATRLPPSLLFEAGHHWPVFLGGVVSTIAAAAGLGALLARGGVLPGTTAVWGAMPGAATVMVLMSNSFGADMRLVAFMQYLRVVCVAVVASAVSRLWSAGGAQAPVHWFAPVPSAPLAETLVLAAAGAWLGARLRIPGGPLLLPMAAALILQGTGTMSIALPPWLLGASYVVIGWTVGERFNLAVLRHAAHALPRVLASVMALIALCGLSALVLHQVAGVSPLTAYLATSPGGADSVAIIAASSPVDVPFVMAMQMGRFLLVLLIGPRLARWIARAMSGPGGIVRPAP